MRPNVLGIFAIVALAAAAALAIQQSPNFSSLTTGLYILTTDARDYRYVVVPLPYREQPRTISAPVPEKDLGTARSTPTALPQAGPETTAATPSAEPANDMDMGLPAVTSATPTPTSSSSAPTPTPTTTGSRAEGRR